MATSSPLLFLILFSSTPDLDQGVGFDRRVALTLETDQVVSVTWDIESTGTLHVWLEGALDGKLDVSSATDSEEDDGSQIRGTPYIEFSVVEPGRIEILASGSPGDAVLRGVLEPDGNEARAATDEVAHWRQEAEALLRAGDQLGARQALATAVRLVEETPQSIASSAFAMEMNRVGSLALEKLRDPVIALSTWERTLAQHERVRPPDDPQLQAVRHNTAMAFTATGRLGPGAALQEQVVQSFARTRDSDDPARLSAEDSLALTLHDLGEYDRALELLSSVLERRIAALGEDHTAVQHSRQNLARTLVSSGDLRRAERLNRAAVGAFETTRSADDFELLRAQMNLAAVLSMLGNLEQARVQQERALAGMLRIFPADSPVSLSGMRILATIYRDLGRLADAEAMIRRVLRVDERAFAENHLLRASDEEILATVVRKRGDLTLTEELHRSTLDLRRTILPEHHEDVLLARLNLASVILQRGRYAEALDLYDVLAEEISESLDARHSMATTCRAERALALHGLGRDVEAREIEESVYLGLSADLPAHHPGVLQARHNLANALFREGQFREAAAHEEAILSIRSASLPADHPDLQNSRMNLAGTRLAARDPDGAQALITEMTRHELERILRTSAAEPPRFVASLLETARQRFSAALGYARFLREQDGQEQYQAFTLFETARGAELRAAAGVRAALRNPAFAEFRHALQTAEADVADAASGSQGAPSLGDAIRRRDGAQRALLQASTLEGVSVRAVSVGEVSSRLAPDQAAVGFWRIDQSDPRQVDRLRGEETDRFIAFVALSDESLRIVDFGPALALEQSVRRWRAAAGAPALEAALRGERGERGKAVPTEPATGFPEARADMRATLLEPLELVAPDVQRWIIAWDDVLHLAPIAWLDSNGDSSIRSVPALTHRREVDPGAGRPVLFGAIDYGPTPDSRADHLPEGGFRRLSATGPEIDAIASLWADEDRPVIIRRADTASAAELQSLAADAAYLHIATHGFFSTDDQVGLAALSPRSLAGLAMANANASLPGSSGTDGLLTAEELAALDLSSCRLAVLSACETHVGLRRFGQGLASLQTALHAAGVTEVLSALWPVEDEATRFFMIAFYRALWQDELSAADALQHARLAVRTAVDDAGHPRFSFRDWGAWVLTGPAH